MNPNENNMPKHSMPENNMPKHSMPEQETASGKVLTVIARLLELADSIEKKGRTKLAPVMSPALMSEDDKEPTWQAPKGMPPLFVEMGDNLLNLEVILQKIDETLDRVDI